MSWIEKELKKRTAETKPSALSQASLALEPERIQDLWSRFQAANRALPNELQLPIDKMRRLESSAEESNILEWLQAPNGAALGFSGIAVRYVWPERSQRKSKNFWIRWNVEQQGYVLRQRVSSSATPLFSEYNFNDRYSEYMIKCLVQGERIKLKSVSKKRFWLF